MGPTGWLAWLIVGGFSGALVGVVMHGWLETIEDITLGVLGALAGGFVFTLVGVPGTSGFYVWSIFTAFVGAVSLITMIRFVNSTDHHRSNRSRTITI